MLTIIRSPVPCIPVDPCAWPAEAAELLRAPAAHPERYLWLVPTERRLQALRCGAGGECPATLTPRVETFPAIVSLALSYCPEPRRRLASAQRLPRLARAWQVVSGRVAGPSLVQSLDRLVYDWQACGVEPQE